MQKPGESAVLQSITQRLQYVFLLDKADVTVELLRAFQSDELEQLLLYETIGLLPWVLEKIGKNAAPEDDPLNEQTAELHLRRTARLEQWDALLFALSAQRAPSRAVSSKRGRDG